MLGTLVQDARLDVGFSAVLHYLTSRKIKPLHNACVHIVNRVNQRTTLKFIKFSPHILQHNSSQPYYVFW